MSEKLTFRAVDIKPENFLRVINPDTQFKSYENIITYNTGLYGSKYDNAYPDLLIDLYENGSAVHQNLVETKSNLILGNNLQAENDTESANIDPFIRKRNKSGDNLQNVYAKAAKDYALFDAAVLQVVFNREGKVAEVYHVPTKNFRLGLPNKYNQILWGFLCQRWGDITNSIEARRRDSVKIHMWDPDNWQKYPTQLLYIKGYGFNYYSVPTYNSSIPWIMLDREISDFHLNNVRSNFFLSMMITQIKGGMSDEQIAENAKELEDFYSGSKGRKVLLSYVDDMNDKPVIDNISGSELDKVFDILGQQAFQHVITAHRAFPILGGFEGTSTDLNGDSNKLTVALSAFNQMVCQPMKDVLIDGFNRILEWNELPAVTSITSDLKLAQPVPQPDDLTRNERRAMLYGLPEIDDSVNNVDNPNLIPEE